MCVCVHQHPSQTTYLIDLFTVNRIKELHKVTVRIPPDNEKSNLIRIEGDPQGVQEAKKELLELASRMVGRDLSSQKKLRVGCRCGVAKYTRALSLSHRRMSVQRT